ncbi:MAG: 16S rRNA (cytidine(1402)-2'-O)-methyltransferase [Dehalococcoidia bacterium]|nr:MAG: 16S rRNA (cytidine(1402)-2'-O)-methyltransferase [Dehalococcoidia bacterium]
MTTLYIVATPIGNLEDISLRALRTLCEVKLIACEDTRYTHRLLKAYDIKTPTTSYREQNKKTKTAFILEQLAKGDVAVVSDSGMPGVSDAGPDLVDKASREGFPVVVIPGPSVVTTALAASGLPTGKFIFLGFLPHKPGARKKVLESVAGEEGTIVLLESPHRLAAALEDMLGVLDNRRIVVCRELTKIYEEIFRGTISQAIARFTEPKGEFTLVVSGQPAKKRKSAPTTDLVTRLGELRAAGVSAKDAMALAGDRKVSRKEMYRTWLDLQKQRKAPLKQ